MGTEQQQARSARPVGRTIDVATLPRSWAEDRPTDPAVLVYKRKGLGWTVNNSHEFADMGWSW